jgi:hypothetical protein
MSALTGPVCMRPAGRCAEVCQISVNPVYNYLTLVKELDRSRNNN